MKIFIDSADLEEIKKYHSWGLCDGVTTNPTICLKDGIKGLEAVKVRTKEIAELIAPSIVSVEVTSDNPEEIVRQARDYAAIADNIAVKVTITDRAGGALLPVIYGLAEEGVRINVTAMTTFNQAILAAKTIAAGLAKSARPKSPNFISIFGGRISQEHGVEHTMQVLRNVRACLDTHDYKNIELLVGSVRSPENVEMWARSGAHILTIPPEVLDKCLSAAGTQAMVAQFITDAQRALE